MFQDPKRVLPQLEGLNPDKTLHLRREVSPNDYNLHCNLFVYHFQAIIDIFDNLSCVSIFAWQG